VNGTRGGPSARGETIGQTLPASHRLRHRSEFKKVQERGQRYVAGALVLLVLPNDLGYRRLGVTVSSKVGNAVVRSRIKRWFREIFRKRRALLPPSVDAVLIARSGAADSSLEALGRDFEAAAAQARRRAQGRSGPGPVVEKGVR
jgi:ribonuclease P protein component